MLAKKRYKASGRIKERNKIKRYAGNFVKITILAAVVLGPIFVLRADFLQVKGVEVLGAEGGREASIKENMANALSGMRFFLIPKSNVLLLDEEGLAAALLSEFPSLEEVNIDKKVNKTVEVKVKERVPEFLWCAADENCFNMDRSGLIFSYSSKASRDKEKIMFKGVIEGDPILQNFTTVEKMQNFMKAIEILQNAKLHIYSIDIELADKAVFSTNLGNIILNPEEDISISSANAVLLINELRTKNPSIQFSYIDARFGTKIFYR